MTVSIMTEVIHSEDPVLIPWPNEKAYNDYLERLEYVKKSSSKRNENEAEKTVTKVAMRNRNRRRRIKSASLYWELRLKTGTDHRHLIEDALEHASDIVENTRLEAIKAYEGFAVAYPSRCKQIKRNGKSKQKGDTVK